MNGIDKISFKKANIVDLMTEIIMKINQVIVRVNKIDKDFYGKQRNVQVQAG